MSNLGNSIADEWTASTSYDASSLVMHGSQLWKCINAHTSGSAWDSSNWVEGNVVNDLVSISQNSLTSGGISVCGVFSKPTDTESIENGIGYIELNLLQKLDGNIDPSTKTWEVTSFVTRTHIVISVLPGDIITTKAPSEITVIMAFLSEYNVVEGESAGVIGNMITFKQTSGELTYTVPENAIYCYIQATSGDENRLPLYLWKNKLQVPDNSISSSKIVDNAITTVKISDSASIYGSNEIAQVFGNVKNIGFDQGSILNSDGSFYGVEKYRISHRRLIHAQRNFILQCTSAYQIIIYTFQDDGTPIGYDGGWTTEKSITAGTNFRMQIKANPEDITIQADVDTFVSALSLNNSLSDICNTNTENIANVQNDINYIKNPISEFELKNGYIDFTIWKDLSSSNRKYIILPFDKTGTYNITASANGASQIAFLSAYNPIEGGDASVLNFLSMAAASSSSGNIPSGTKYVYFLAVSGTNRLPSKCILAGIDYNAGFLNSIYNKVEELNGDGILSFNPSNEVKPRFDNLLRRYFTNGGEQSSFRPVLSLLHFSDIHGDNTNILRIKDFVDEYQDYISDVINTGDLIQAQFIDGMPTAYSQVTSFINVIGNHDACNRTGTAPNYDWVVVDKKQVYDLVIAPYVSGWAVTQPSDASSNGYCYYYKDYSSNYVRLIVLDCLHWDATQLIWLTTTLTDAKTNNLHVIMANHYVPFVLTQPSGNPFTSIDLSSSTGVTINFDDAANAVKTFIDGGGNFVCWIVGHTHQDQFGVGPSASGFDNQLVICVATASVAPSVNFGEMGRANYDKTQDCFNIIGVDTNSKTIKLMRIGANYDRYMRRKNTLSWDYNTNRLIYVD